MSRMLQSYASGAWYTAADAGSPILSAVDGTEVARMSARGLDVPAMIEYGRKVGAPALAQLNFHQRALLMKDAALKLMDHKKELYALSATTGATAGDSAVDIDGGIFTAIGMSSKARRELPVSTVYLDGLPDQLGKSGTFLGQHICTTRPGVVVQINAFNFPVWGFMEKLAPAFIAGMPSIVKPAGQTAQLTEAAVRILIDSGVLPEGSLQLLAGSAHGIMDHLDFRDVVAFTGSANTARTLAADPGVIVRGVVFSAEADSLNCAVLGPDAGPDTEEFALFVREVAREMTVKAGQKCTAIRRAIVPEQFKGAVIQALQERLAKVKIGNPLAEGVRMGALASLEQRDEVRRAVAKLRTNADLVFGDPDRVEVIDADAEKGAFISPLLLAARDPRGAAIHDVEAFGPVSTVVGYTSTDDAVALAARGSGSLVASVITADPQIARTLVRGLAPYHGRILILNARDAKASTGHGSPLPVLVHGGPGRAGGGEELGGIRGVLHFMQRTAVQGDPDSLTAVGDRWVRGAVRYTGDVHPFRKSLAELKLGDTVVAGPRQITEADVQHFAEFTGDTFYAHTNEKAAQANPLFGGRVAHGYLVVSFAAGLFVSPEPGPVLANFGVDQLRFLTPVKFGDAITVTLTAKQIAPRASVDYGEVRWDATVTNQRDEVVASYDVLTLVAKTQAGAIRAA